MENQDWKVQREQRLQAVKQFRENLVESVMKEYGFNKAVAEKIVAKGWEDGHAYGYSEVMTQAYITADFAKEVIKAAQS